MKTIPFNSRYVSKEIYDELDDDNKEGIFIGNPYYKTDEFQDKYKQALFNLLIIKFKMFRENNYILQNQPLCCRDKCNDFLGTCDDIYSWFENCYEKSECIEVSKAIPLGEI